MYHLWEILKALFAKQTASCFSTALFASTIVPHRETAALYTHGQVDGRWQNFIAATFLQRKQSASGQLGCSACRLSADRLENLRQ